MSHKRPVKDAGPSDNKEKRPRNSMQSVVLEAVKLNNAMKLWESLEPVLRKVVSEEAERAMDNFISLRNEVRVAPKHIQGSECQILYLRFQTKLASHLFTGSKLEGEHGGQIQIVLQDATTGQIVTAGDAASAKLDVVVLEGDFAIDDEEDWTSEQFQNHEVKEREGRRPLLTGDLALTLKEGVGTLGQLVFTDNSSWIRSRKFRLGVKVADERLKGVRVREAKTEAFSVKDHRGELYKKHFPPKLKDDVWRLKSIGKDGAYHKRLLEQNILTVKDFLVQYSTVPSKLREMFGNNMSSKTWDSIIEHAHTCILDETQHVYYPDNNHSIGVILNTVYQPLGIVRGDAYVPSSSLSDIEQVDMDRLVQDAYHNLSSLKTFPLREEHKESRLVNRHGDSFHGQVFQMNPDFRTPSQRDGLDHSFPAGRYSESHTDENTQMVQQRQQFRPLLEQRSKGNLDGSLPASFTVNYPWNMSQTELLSSRFGRDFQQSLMNTAYASESLDRAISFGQFQHRESVHGGQDDFKWLDDYGQEIGYEILGNNEVQMLSNTDIGDQALGVRGNSILRTDTGFPIANLSVSSSLGKRGGSLNQRAYMGWIKLKAALKLHCFTKKKMT